MLQIQLFSFLISWHLSCLNFNSELALAVELCHTVKLYWLLWAIDKFVEGDGYLTIILEASDKLNYWTNVVFNY